MTSEDQIVEIFAAALEVGEGQRSKFIALQCGGDPSMAAEIEQLLKDHDEAASSGFLSNSAIEIEAAHFADEQIADGRVGQQLGQYEVIERIGMGGMGTIYLAKRFDDFQKQVAVKIIKRGMDTEAILARFRRERQILAHLEHPNIARLIDGGTTPDGLPYFVLEYIDGISITDHCKGLKEKEILTLFRKVCAAVSFAHQNLIVHRDIKPSNILVNSDGEPKLLDFGIAKLLDQTAEDETHTLQRILTPAFASPEHISGDIVTTASDVYSLGKVLSELLCPVTGKALPFRPAKALSPDPKLNPDLQKILSMAVRDDPEHRYRSAEQFSHDIRRYLDGLPVSARNISFSYRSSKFVQRNKAKVTLAFLLLISVIAGLAATIFNANEARRERNLAERRFDNLRKLSDSFVTELHAAIQNLPGSLPARRPPAASCYGTARSACCRIRQ